MEKSLRNFEVIIGGGGTGAEPPTYVANKRVVEAETLDSVIIEAQQMPMEHRRWEKTSTHVYVVDDTGQVVWAQPLPSFEPFSHT